MNTQPTQSSLNTTNWVAIWAIYFSGCSLALHVGKLPAALPLIVEEFNLSIAQTGNFVGVYGLLIASVGLVVGLSVTKFGYVLFAIGGIALAAFGSGVGFFAESITGLMIGRMFEGFGWIISVVAIPALLGCLSVGKAKPIVMGLWGSFMSIGSGAMLLLAPYLQSVGGWRTSWASAGVLSALAVVAMLYVTNSNKRAFSPLYLKREKPKLSVIFNANAIALMFCFLFYSALFVAVTAFLPSILVTQTSMSLNTAAVFAAVAMLVNGVGNISSGWLINRGYKHQHIIAVASLAMGLLSLLVFGVQNPSVIIVSAILLTCIGGLIPGTLFSTAQYLASSAVALGLLFGFMLQGAGMGQLSGPLLITRVVEWSSSWVLGGVALLAAGIAGALCTCVIKVPAPAKLNS